MLSVKQFEQDKKYPNYKPSKDEVVKISFVRKRFREMQQARTIVDKNWDTYQTMINAIFVPYPDERSSSVVPLSSSVIELYVAEANKIQTEYNFKGETSEYGSQAKAIEHVWKYDWRKNNRKKEFIENEYITAWFWTSIIFTWFEAYNKTQKDFIVWDDLQYAWKEKTFKKENIIVKNIDIRNFYIDNQVIWEIEDASDCIWIQWMSYEKFQNLKNTPIYKNIDKVTPKQFDNEYNTFVLIEETTKQWDFVKLEHYWNVEKDVYMVLANWVLVREHPMISTIDWEKALPFIIRILWKKSYSIYGRWFCEALMMFNSEINNLRELLMDWIRRSNTQVLALWNWLNFDWRTFSYDNEILTFDWNLANNFQQISWNPPNQAIFSYLNQLYKDIAVYIGIDINNIIWSPNKTAFEVEVQREASQKRVNVRLVNRDLAFERFANLYKDLLQTYFPRKTAEWLYPVIEIEGEEYKNGKFKKKKWTYQFEVTPETLRWDIYIDVYTNTNTPTINAVDKAQKLELLNTVWQIWQWYMMAKQAGIDMEEILPIKQTLRDLASDFNLDVQSSSSNEDVKAAKNELMQGLRWMMKQPQQAVEWQPQEQIQPNTMQQWQTM